MYVKMNKNAKKVGEQYGKNNRLPFMQWWQIKN
jgi:hypothetical protein